MMEVRTLARTSFQVLAFGMFVFEMQNSVRKYIAKPVVQHTLEGKYDKYELPVIYVCNYEYFDFNLANQTGYTALTRYLAGDVRNEEKTTWKGSHKNVTFKELQKSLYPDNFSSLKMLNKDDDKYNEQVQFEKVFLPTYGYCMKVQKPPKHFVLQATIVYTVLLVDPALDNNVNTFQMEDTKIHLGPTGDGNQTGIVYELKISIHDSRIHDGIKCTDYDENDTTYGKCIENVLEKRLLDWYGCIPAWSLHHSNLSCEVKPPMKLTETKTVVKEIGQIVRGQISSVFSVCLQPCVKMSVKVNELKTFANRVGNSFLRMEFLNDVMIYTDVYAYDMFSLVIDLGSSLGLWLGLSAISIFDLILHAIGVTLIKKICYF